MIIMNIINKILIIKNNIIRKCLLRIYGYTTLNIIHNVMTKNSINYFIDFGTLLGFIREKGFIKNDLDIDIGIIYDNNLEIIVKRHLNNEKFVLLKEYLYNGEVVQQSFIKYNIKIDINYYFNSNDKSICYLFYNKKAEESISVVKMEYNIISNTQDILINNNKYKIPRNYNILLEQKYGINWQIPDEKWIYWEAPVSIKCDGCVQIIKY